MQNFKLHIGATLFLAAAACFPSKAPAADGTVLINQNTAINGLPGCAKSPSALITICQSGSYRLSGNITVASDNLDAILVTNNANVTLDLNGFSVVGPNSCSTSTIIIVGGELIFVLCTDQNAGTGIHGDGLTTVAVYNGIVKGFGIGVLVQGGTVENVTITQMSGIGLNIASGTARSNHVSTCGGGGIQAQSSVVTDNTVFKNGTMGINTVQSSVINNVIETNAGPGIQGVCPSTAIGNTVHKSDGGITLSADCTVVNNSVL